jgi:tetratricopeptide (TPR) repeat protein
MPKICAYFEWRVGVKRMLLCRESFRGIRGISILLLIFWFSAVCFSSAADMKPEDVDTINPKAEKYLNLLIQNPSGDYLYDRFYDAWLDTGTVEGLEGYLKQNVLKSKETSGLLILAFFYEKQGNDKESLSYFQKASSENPTAEILYKKASVEARLLDFNSAISDLNEADKKCKEKELRIKINKLLGRLYIRNGQKDLAVQNWDKLITSNSDDEDIYEDIIELQISEGLYEQAINTSDQFLEKTKDNYKRVMRQLRKADIYQYSGKNEQALEIYAKSLELVSQGTWLENQICSQIERVFQRQDDIKALREYWEKMIEAQPQRISIKKRLAQLYLKLSEDDKALGIYQEIVRITPGDKLNQKVYIEALRSVSQTSKALDMMNELCRQNPDDRELLIDLADLYYLNRDTKAVANTLDKYIDKSDKSEYIFLRVARILENYNYKEKVLEVFDKLLAKYPQSLTAKEAYAEVLYRYENIEKALELWNAIAQAGDIQTLLRIAKTVSTRQYSELSLNWLEARYDEYGNDISYLNQLCDAAIRLGLYEKSRPWLEKQLIMADRFSLIQDAVRQRMLIEKSSGNIDKTIAELKSLTGRSIQQCCLLSELLEYNHQSDEAQNILDKFIGDVNSLNISDSTRNKEKETALHQKIHLYSISKQWEQAADCTKKLIALKGTQNSAYIRELINLYEKAGQWRLALDWIPAWKNASSGSTEPYLTESGILRKLNEVDTAVEQLRAANQVFDDNKDILTELASLYRLSNHSAEAYRIIWRLYDEADDVSDKLDYIRELASISRNMGNIDALIEKLQEQRSNNRTSTVPLLALAEAYRQAGRNEERLQVFMEAVRLKPDDITLLNEIARIQESEGFWEQAVETLKQAMLIDSTGAAKQKLARLYIQYGSEEEGYRLLFDISDNANINSRDVQTTIQALIAETNWDIAEKYLDDVLHKFPDDYRLHYLYAICLEENGKIREALEKFTQLLEMKTEIPGNTTQSILSQQTGNIDQIGKIAPQGTKEILYIQQVFNQALSYRRDYDNLPYWYYPNRSRQSININLPQNVEDVSGFAIAHILSIMNNSTMAASEINKELREATVQRIVQENNYSSLQFIFDINQINIDNFVSSIVELAPKYPENEVLQGLWVIYNSSDRSKDEKHVREVFEMFKESYPSLASMLGLSYGSSEKTGTDILEESINIIEKLDNPSNYVISMSSQVLRAQDSLLTQGQKTRLANKLMSWYDESSSQPSQNQGNMFYYLLSSILTSRDKDGLIKILNKEVENYKNRVKPSNTGAIYSQFQIQELRYPPIYNMPDFPNAILQILLESGNEGTMMFGRIFDSNNIDSFTGQLNDPVLKAVVCLAANQEDKALKILEEQIRNDTQSISAHLIMASLLAKQNKKDQAIPILAKVQSLKPDNTTQQIVDGAIVFYAQNIDFSQYPDELEIARKAAIRFSQVQFQQPQDRDNLIQAMNNLGLKDEARLFAKKITVIAGNQNQIQQGIIQQGMIYQVSGRTQDLSTVQYNKIVSLLQEDKKDAAMRLLLTDLETIASNSLLPERFYDNSNSNNRISLVHAYQLEDKIIEMADPGPSRNIRKLLIFARMCDLISREDNAKKVYEKILQQRPNEFGALLWLAFCYVDNEPDKAVKYLSAVDRRYQSQLGRQLSNYIQNNYQRETMEKTFDFVELASLYLNSLKDTNSIDLNWAANIPTTIANSYSRNNIRLPHLYSESQSNVMRTGRNEVPVKEQEELINRRREVHNQFCKSMLEIPQLTQQGFAFLHSEARARGAIDNEDMSVIALDALLKYQPYRNSSYRGLINSYSWSTGGKDNRLLSPIEFLVYQNWKQGTLDKLLEKTVPVLEKNNRMAESRQIQLFASLYQAPAENYISRAKELLGSDIISENSSRNALVSRDSALSQIIEIRSDRSLKISLNQFLIDLIDINNRNSLNQVQNFTRNYLTQLVKEDRESANEFLEQIVTIFLGPKEKRKEFVSQNYNQRQISGSNTNTERVYICVNLLRTLSQNSELLFTILSQFDGFEEYMSDVRYYVQNGLDNAIQKTVSSISPNSGVNGDITGLLNMLDDSPFLGDVNSFRTLPAAQLQKSSVYSYMIYRLWQNSGSQYVNVRLLLRETFANRIKQDSVQSAFGEELFIAQLSDNRRQEVYECLGRYWNHIQKLDAARQQEISIMISDTVGMMTTQDNSLSDSIRLVAAGINELRNQAGKVKVNEFLKNRQFEDFKVSESQFIENTSSLIASVASYDANSGVEILLRAEKIIEDARKRGKYQYNSNRDLTSRIFNRMQEDSRAFSFSSIGFIIKLMRDMNEPVIGLEPYYITQLENPLSERFRQYISITNNNQVEALKKLYNEIGPYTGKGNLAGLNIFRRVFDSGNWNEQVINEAITWADEQAKSGDYPDLARALGVNAALYKQQRFTNRSNRNGANTSANDSIFTGIEKYYTDTLTDQNLSLQWRLMANYTFLQNFSNLASDDIIKQGVKLIIQGWSSSANINAEYCTGTIQRFLNSGTQNTERSSVALLPNSRKNDWNITAAKLSDTYMAFRQPGQVSTPIVQTRYAQPSGYNENQTIQLSMLEINLLLNRDDSVRAMLDGFDSRIGTYLDSWALLVKYNKSDILKSVIEKQWSNRINQMGVVRFTNEIEKNLSGCIEILQLPETRYYAEVLISSLQDEGGNEQKPGVQRNERLKRLAGKFGEITFNSIPIKHKIIEIYINDTSLMPLLSKYIIQEGKNLNPAVIAASQDSNLIQAQGQLLAAYCTASLLDGDPNVFSKTVHALSMYPAQNQPFGVRQILDMMGRQLVNIADTIQNNWTESQISLLATATAEYISCSSQGSDQGRLVSNLIVFLVLSNRENEISAALERSSSNIQQNLQYYQNISELSNTLGRFIRNRNLTIEQRVEIIKRFYQTEQVQAAMNRENQRDMFSFLTNYNILSREEIEQNRDLLKSLFVQTKKIEAFLKAANLKEININQDESQFRQYISSLLNSTMWQDIDLCKKVMVKVVYFLDTFKTSQNPSEISPENMTGSTAFQQSNSDFISSILLQRDSSNFSLADVGIITGLLRDANSPQIAVNQEYLNRIVNVINSRYQKILQEKNQNRLEAFQKFYSEVGPYFGKGNASGFSSFWTSILQNNRNELELNTITTWANEQIEKGEYPKLAAEISVIAKQPRVPPFIGGIRRGQPINAIERDYDKSISQYYLTVITDSNLSVIWRLMALEEHRKRSQFDNNPDDINKDIIFKSIPLVIEGWKLYSDLPEVYYTRLVSAFTKLQDKPNWKELAGQLSDAYEQFRLKSKTQPATSFQDGTITWNNSGSMPFPMGGISGSRVSRSGIVGSNSGFMTRGGTIISGPMGFSGPIDGGMVMSDTSRLVQPAQNIINPIERAMLEIRLILNKDELIQKQLEDDKSSLGNNLDTWVLLIQYGRDTILKNVIEKNWQGVSTNSSMQYTKEIENNIEKLLGLISRNDIRYFTEVVLSSLPDSTMPAQLPAASHKDRIIRLAGQYQKVDFDNQMIKQRILALLINEPDALELVSGSLKDQATKIDINTLLADFNNTARDQFNLVLAYCCERLLTGDPNNFINTLKTVASNTSGTRQNINRELLNIMSENLIRTAGCTMSNWTSGQMAAFASASTEIFSQNNVSLNNYNGLFINHYIFFVLAEKTDELQNAYTKFSSQNNYILQNMQRPERLSEYYVQLAGYLVNRKFSFEQRLDIINHFNKPDWIMSRQAQTRSSPNINIVQMLVDRGIFTRQETIEHSSSFHQFANPAINAFLNAKSLGEVTFNNMPLDLYIDNIISSVNTNDTDLLMKIVIKAGELYQQDLKSGITIPNLRISFLNRILSRLTQQDGNALQCLDIVVRLMRDTKDNGLFPDSSIYRIDSDIVSAYLRSPQTPESKLDNFKKFYHQIGPFVGKGNASGIAGIFSYLFSNQQWRDNRLLDLTIQWLHQESQSGDYPLLAREIEIIATVYQNNPMYGRTPDQEKTKIITEYYDNILSDVNLPLQWRLMAVHAMERWISSPVYDELADKAMDVLTQSCYKSPFFSWDLHNNLLTRFVRSAHRQDTLAVEPRNNLELDFSPLRSGWADSASKVLDVYMKTRFMYQADSNFTSSFVASRTMQSVALSELVMLEISLLLKENDAASKLLNKNDGTLKTSSCSLALLIQYQNNTLLKQFVEDNIEKIMFDTRGIYNPQLEERIAESLNYIQRKDIQYFIKVLLYAHNNNNSAIMAPFGSGRQENISTRSERLKILAGQFPDIAFTSDIIRKNVLTILIQEASTLPYISAALREQAKNKEINSIISSNQSNMPENPEFQLFLADRMNLLFNGDPNGFLEIVKIIRPNITDSQRGFISYNLSSSVISGYLRLISSTDWKAENINSFIVVSKELLTLYNSQYYSSDILQLVCCRAALLLLADEMSHTERNNLEEIESTFAILQQFATDMRGRPQNNFIIRYNDLPIAHQVIAKYMNSMNLSFDARMEILDKYYNLEPIKNALKESQGNNSMLSLVSRNGIFTVDEVIAHADVLMAQPYINEASWQTLAFYQAREGLLDDAEKSWRKAAEIGIKSEKPWNMQSYIYFLNTNNLRDKALDNWRTFDIKSLSQKSLSEYKILMQTLENQN